MTNSKIDEVKDDRKLKGKTNFIGQKREFKRTAKANNIFEYLTGKEVVLPKPKKEDYFVKLVEVDTRRPVRSKKTAQNVTPLTDDDEEANDTQTIMSTNNSLQQYIDLDKHKTVRAKIKLVGRLLNAQVSDGIKIEIEDYIDTKEDYDFIKKRYTVTRACP